MANVFQGGPVRYTNPSRPGAGAGLRGVGYGGPTASLGRLLSATGGFDLQPPSITNQYAADPRIAGVSTAGSAPTTFQTPIPGSPGAFTGTIDFSTDPILQRVTALARQNVQQAQAGADAAAKQALINYGFGDVADKYRFGSPADALLGLGDTTAVGDAATAEAARNNPYSVAALLGKAHQQQDVGIDQNQNAQNLFYSSNRSNMLGDEAQNYLGKQYGAQQDLASQLAGIAQNLIAARQGAEQQVLGEQENAYMRALQNAQNAGQPAAPQQALIPDYFAPLGNASPGALQSALRPYKAPTYAPASTTGWGRAISKALAGYS